MNGNTEKRTTGYRWVDPVVEAFPQRDEAAEDAAIEQDGMFSPDEATDMILPPNEAIGEAIRAQIRLSIHALTAPGTSYEDIERSEYILRFLGPILFEFEDVDEDDPHSQKDWFLNHVLTVGREMIRAKRLPWSPEGTDEATPQATRPRTEPESGVYLH